MPYIRVNGRVKDILDLEKERRNAASFNKLFETVFISNKAQQAALGLSEKERRQIARIMRVNEL